MLFPFVLIQCGSPVTWNSCIAGRFCQSQVHIWIFLPRDCHTRQHGGDLVAISVCPGLYLVAVSVFVSDAWEQRESIGWCAVPAACLYCCSHRMKYDHKNTTYIITYMDRFQVANSKHRCQPVRIMISWIILMGLTTPGCYIRPAIEVWPDD